MSDLLNAKADAREPIVPNDLKKGDRVLLNYGGPDGPWEADIADNKKGNIRLCKVYGFYTELGSVYTHDICAVKVTLSDEGETWYPLNHTKEQKKLRVQVKNLW